MMDDETFVQFIHEQFPSLKISLQDMLQPSSDFVMKYYMLIIAEIMRMDIKTICGFSLDQIDFLNNPVGNLIDQHFVYKYNLYMAVKYILDRMYIVEDISISFSDLIMPYLAPRRSGVFMKYLYIFFDFCCDFDNNYNQVNRMDDLKIESAQLRNACDAVRQEIEEKHNIQQQNAERVRELKARLVVLNSTNEEHQNVLKDLWAQRDVENEKIRQIDEQERNLQEQLTKRQNEKRYLESLVVPNEEDIVSQFTILNKKREEGKLKVQEFAQKTHDRALTISQFDELLMQLDKRDKELDEELTVEGKSYDFPSLYGLSVSLRKECDTLEKDVANVLEQIKESDGRTKPLSEKLKSMESEKKSLTDIFEEKSLEYNLKLEKCQNTLFENIALYEEISKETADHTEKQERLKKEIEDIDKEIKRIDNEGQQNYEKLCSHLKSTVLQIKKKI